MGLRPPLSARACGLAKNVDRDERHDIGPVGGKHLIGAHAALAHAVDDEAHNVRVAIRKQRHEKKRRYDKAPKQALMLARYLPVVMQRAACGRLLHEFPLAPLLFVDEANAIIRDHHAIAHLGRIEVDIGAYAEVVIVRLVAENLAHTPHMGCFFIGFVDNQVFL